MVAADLLQQRNGEFRPCYERGLKQNTNLRYLTRLTARVVVSPRGHASSLTISPDTQTNMEDCMSRVMGRWQFARYTGAPIVVEVPVTLRAVD